MALCIINLIKLHIILHILNESTSEVTIWYIFLKKMQWWTQKFSTCRIYAINPYHLHFKKNIFYLFLKERQSMSRGGAERETHTESEAGSRLWTLSTEPDAGLKPMNLEIMTWAEVGCLTDWATQELQLCSFRNTCIVGHLCEIKPCVGLYTDSMEPTWDFLSLFSLCPCPVLALYLKINK